MEKELADLFEINKKFNRREALKRFGRYAAIYSTILPFPLGATAGVTEIVTRPEDSRELSSDVKNIRELMKVSPMLGLGLTSLGASIWVYAGLASDLRVLPNPNGKQAAFFEKDLMQVLSERNNLPIEETKLEQYPNQIKKILTLPPVGAKITYPQADNKNQIVKVRPRLTAEQAAPEVYEKTLAVKESPFVVQQFTVQGRLGDSFKMVPLALLLHSPITYDWDQPSYELPWGQVAPLIHDGDVRSFKYTVESYNPNWSKVSGRTDFLMRMVLTEDTESDYHRLVTDYKAYQRLALANHAYAHSIPEHFNKSLKEDLADSWINAQKRFSTILSEYDLTKILDTRWFNYYSSYAWQEFGPRYEAQWSPIKRSLNYLNKVAEENPELVDIMDGFLKEETDKIDKIVGIR